MQNVYLAFYVRQEKGGYFFWVRVFRVNIKEDYSFRITYGKIKLHLNLST